MVVIKCWLSSLLLLLTSFLTTGQDTQMKLKIDQNSNLNRTNEERLRERWTAFVAEVNKELDFDLNASSPLHLSAVENRDLYLTCAFTKPLRRHQISFLRLKDFSLLYIGKN